MRVIAGTARSLLLETPAGMDTRPTTDRIKETLFNMLAPEIPGARFLDLFAGSGGIGIEALSRGAESACFVDSARDAVNCIRKNLEHTHMTERAVVYGTDWNTALLQLEREHKTFDVVFMDPPYNKGIESAVLAALASSGLIHEGSLIVVEASAETDSEAVKALGYRIRKIKTYRTNQHWFLEPDR